MRYTIIIQWSDEDDAYVVTLPEWEETGEYFVRTYGDTYDEALRNGEDLLAELIAQADSKPLPQSRVFGAAIA
ncbi:MAG TPA: type II toxin-antitoxin system HicB family antitoxin [Ktedonobacterales bacterium]|nr:type II toxin-antitoxin system HicB family antitoxin [Ktedonobacterales bacterium]